MIRCSAFALVGIGCLGLSHAQGVDLAKDERLSKSLSIEQKMVTLAQATASLSKTLGFPIEASPSLKDRRVTILVKDRPAHAVMSAIASTLDLEWEADGTLLRIKANTDMAAAERRYLAEEERTLRASAEMILRKLMTSAQGTYEQAAERDSSLTLEKYALGQHLRSMNQGQWNALWSGAQVVARMVPGGVPQPVGRGQRRQQSFAPPITAFVRFDPLTGALEGTPTSIGTRSEAAGVPPTQGRGLQIARPADKLAELPFGKRVLEWEKRSRDEDFAKRIGQVNVTSEEWFGNRFSAADSLVALHQASGLPIVADAFRVPSLPDRSGGTADEWLTRFARQNGMFVRVDGGFAMLRHGGFWKLRQLDVPEKSLSTLEASQSPSLEAYANFAAGLTPLQAQFYRRRNTVLLRVDDAPFANAMPALRFYGSLGGLQRVARQGQPVAFSAMSSVQRNLFLEAMGVGAPSGRARQINLQRDAGSLAFLLQLSDMNTVSGVTTGTTLIFGVSPTDAFRFQVAASPQA